MNGEDYSTDSECDTYFASLEEDARDEPKSSAEVTRCENSAWKLPIILLVCVYSLEITLFK